MESNRREGAAAPRIDRKAFRWIVLVVLMVVLAVSFGRFLGACSSDGPGTAANGAATESTVADSAQDAADDHTTDDVATGHTPDGAPAASSEANAALTLADIPADVLISVDELQQMRASDAPLFIVDIRGQNWWRDGHIPEARNIPAGKQFDIRMDEIPRDAEVVVIVPRNDERVAEVWQTLVDAGYDGSLIKALDGGMGAWSAAGGDIQEEEHLGC